MNFQSLHCRPPICLLLFLFAALVASGWADEGAVRQNTPRPGGCPDFIELIKEITPVVVNISIERQTIQNSSVSPPPLFRLHPRHFDDRSRPGDKDQSDSLGSGFFCDSAGYIVTNAHVAEGASKILVTLSTGKVMNAKVIAVHPKVDLALLRITPPYPLQKARLGDSSKLQVGEWVLAMGNPFGLGSTGHGGNS